MANWIESWEDASSNELLSYILEAVQARARASQVRTAHRTPGTVNHVFLHEQNKSLIQAQKGHFLGHFSDEMQQIWVS